MSSNHGLRRLSLQYDESPKDNPMLVLIECSTLTCVDIRIDNVDYEDPSVLYFPKSHVKLGSIRELRFTRDSRVGYPLYNDIGDFVKAILEAGSPLEILELDANALDSRLMTLCECPTLRSLVLQGNTWGQSFVEELISKNHAIISRDVSCDDFLKPKAMVDRTLAFEGSRKNCDQAIEEVLEFFSRDSFSMQCKYCFGFDEGFSSKIKFLQEITFEISRTRNKMTFVGLSKLFSIRTLLQTVEVQCEDF